MLISADMQRGDFVQSTRSRSMQRTRATDPHRKLACTADLLRKRPPSGFGWGGQRTEARTVAPDHECEQHPGQADRRPSELPGQLQQRCMMSFGEEVNFVAAPQLSGRNEQNA